MSLIGQLFPGGGSGGGGGETAPPPGDPIWHDDFTTDRLDEYAAVSPGLEVSDGGLRVQAGSFETELRLTLAYDGFYQTVQQLKFVTGVADAGSGPIGLTARIRDDDNFAMTQFETAARNHTVYECNAGSFSLRGSANTGVEGALGEGVERWLRWMALGYDDFISLYYDVDPEANPLATPLASEVLGGTLTSPHENAWDSGVGLRLNMPSADWHIADYKVWGA